MLQTRVMPCLLLRGRALVKTIRFKAPTYVGDPINTIRIFNEKEVDELIFLDITATPEHKEPPYALLEEIAAECFMPFTYGGGVRSLEQMQRLYSLGVEKIALNSAALATPHLIEQAAERFGSQSVVVAIDAKKTWRGYRVMAEGGRVKTKHTPLDWAREAERRGAGEILLTSIDQDGRMEGYDLALTEAVSAAVKVPMIACGGAGAVEDFARVVHEAGASAAATGSLVVYQGPHRAVLINFPARAALEAVLA